MNAAHWLAWLFIGWEAVATAWQLIDKPVTRKFNSTFYLVCSAAAEIAVLAFSIAVVA